ncbi:flavin-dependent oxidoreductase [Pelagibacterium lacus]|uniref:Flavin-dependent oxidoreductase n=1 Tax=Pelagibacterium lacus TaxID=2282655 RepID=A0A369W8E8_9HYPH|nr:flavin-dependent oxidoreductase [Pelagibacterium lacus]RDE09532.1 flavin-dependent oxidoreductase [Pelagibacterium lacus]
MNTNEIIIIGGGVGGLTLALMLHEKGVPARVYEAAPRLDPIGVGISILPHASKQLCDLGLRDALAAVAIQAQESCFYTRFGQLAYKEKLGLSAGYDVPQFQIHRGDLHAVLLDAFIARAGRDKVVTGHKCVRVEDTATSAIVHFVDPAGNSLSPVEGRAAIAADGIHSAVRAQLFPDEGGPIYSGVNMWRGVTRWKPYLTGASYVRAGWLSHGKMVIYPIRDNIDGEGTQLINWVAEIETPEYAVQDWNRRGKLEDFIGAFEDWHFDFLDVPAMIRAADSILEYPMVDKDPLPFWSQGHMTLLGDAAHPMYPRGSNGAGQAILDARKLADELASGGDVVDALAAYDADRRVATAKVVQTNRTNPPDVILKLVHERSGDKPFERIEDVISPAELAAVSDSYKTVAGYDRQKVGNA